MVFLIACDSKPVAARRLCDVLEEEQEPGRLDVPNIQHKQSSKIKDLCDNGRWTWLSSHVSNKEQEIKKRISRESVICSSTLKYIFDKFAFLCKIHGTQILRIQSHEADAKRRHSVRRCNGISLCRISRYCDPFSRRDATDHSSVSSCSGSIKALNLSDIVTEKEVKEENTRLSRVSLLERPIKEAFPADNISEFFFQRHGCSRYFPQA